MATYLELRSLFGESELVKKVMVASVISAEKVASGNDDVPPFDQTAGAHDNRVRWAANAITNPKQEAERLLLVVLAANAGLTVAQIEGATDAAIQSNVDATVDLVATALFSGA